MASNNAREWPNTDQGWHALYLSLDQKFHTSKNSPLHHDNRCPIHGRR